MSDDDIIELTDIVQKGHAPAQAAAPADVQSNMPAAEAQMPDFGADLDELLQNYGKPASAAPAAPVHAPAPAAAASAPTAVDQTVAAPIANQEATDHKVDPNEELELPPLSDLDALLEELGVQDKAPAVDAREAALTGDDLDTVLSSELTATVAPVAPVTPVAPPASPVHNDGGVNLAAVAAGVAAAKAAPAHVQPAAPAPVTAAAAEPVGDEGIDLNELDALLDTVLASAPKSAPAAAPAPEPAPTAQASLSPDDPVIADLRAEVASLRAELDDLRANIDKYAAAAAAKVIREELAVIAASLD